MRDSDGAYEYRSDAEWEAEWIEEHRRHRLHVSAGNWITCLTCGVPLKLSTRRAYEVFDELNR